MFYVPGLHPPLPSIALTNINKRKVSLELYRIAGLALENAAALSEVLFDFATRSDFLIEARQETAYYRGVLRGVSSSEWGMTRRP